MFKKHPRGLGTLFFTEMWERFGFYTMMAIFVLYMDLDFGWPDELKGQIYGIFLAGVYFFPIFGGWMADKFLGGRNTIRIGAIVMAVGYSGMALSAVNRLPIFYLSLILIAVGSGLFKANISVMVGNLYKEGSELKDTGFNIFYMGINIGALVAPLVATFLRNTFNFNICFAVAAVGMLISLAIFQLGGVNYQHADSHPKHKKNTAASREHTVPIMTKEEERQRLASLAILFAIVIFFWMAFFQNGSALTMFAERSTRIYRFLKPETYQFFNPFFIVVLTPLLVSIFSSLRKKGREPTSAAKISIGMFISSLSLVIMIIASLMGGNQDQNIMSPFWLIGTYFFVTISELFVSPMGLSFVSKVAPKRFQGTMMGCWFGATAIGAYASGLLFSFYSKIPHHLYFILLAACLCITGLLVLFFIKKLNRFAG